MKKLLLPLLFIILFTTGCSNIQKSDLDSIIQTGVESRLSLESHYRTGYKYYLPQGVRIVRNQNYNEILSMNRYTMYLYVDVVSFYNKAIEKYNAKDDVYYSKAIQYKDKFGYLEIKQRSKTKYLIEIMYNYAKIEVMVEKNDLNTAVANAISILSSIEYNKSIISNLMGDNVLQFNETDFNIFETKSNESNFLKYEEEYDQYDNKDFLPDSDLIK